MTKIGTPPILEKIIANLRRGWGVFFPAGAPVVGAEAVAVATDRSRELNPEERADFEQFMTETRSKMDGPLLVATATDLEKLVQRWVDRGWVVTAFPAREGVVSDLKRLR